METAKVDIRKLQLLNDRISQTIDALNQVRLSVHGLSHSTAGNPTGLGQPQAGFAPGFAPGGFAQPFVPQPFVPGLSHTSMPYGGAPIGVNPFAIGQPQQGFAQPFMQGLGYGVPQAGWNPQIQGFGGLSHSGAEAFDPYGRPTWSDPLLAVKLAQTFPYAQLAVPPVVTLY
jgi:hypothetical protein